MIVQDSICIKVDDKGRIILPSSLRKSMGIEPGETLQLSFDLANPYTLLIQRKSPEGGSENE
ncbi:MAG: AbrB/MazE/SpoVT family DNA-binding domain-containing protein [archaeon]